MSETSPSVQGRYYFDWAATALSGNEPEKNTPAWFANPSSIHLEGRKAREALENARARCAAVLGVEAENLVFTSGGTESNALAIQSLLSRPKKVGLLYSEVEHPSVRENCLALERFGLFPSPIGVENDGRVSAASLCRSLEKFPGARFAAIMAVNNETGALMDMASLSRIIRTKEGPPLHFHSDLVQAAGKISLDIKGWDLDSASLSAHKLGGERGAGLLYLKKPVETFSPGGRQERHLRSGTEHIRGAISMAECLEKHARPSVAEKARQEAAFRMGKLIRGLKKITQKKCILIPTDREEDDARFSPWILQARFSGIPGEVMVRAMDSSGFALSTGSACSSASVDRPVLSAMGLPEAARLEGIRVSQGWSTTENDIEALLAGFEKVLARL